MSVDGVKILPDVEFQKLIRLGPWSSVSGLPDKNILRLTSQLGIEKESDVCAVIGRLFLGSVGADANDEMLELLLSNMKGKDINELIASGREKMASAVSGCGGGGVGSGAVEVKIAEKAEEKKEEKVAEQKEEEESDDEPILNLFGDD
nr:PREDICTED: 60S acidic ribosomal protein P2-like [Daucus carota subsp. sativus]